MGFSFPDWESRREHEGLRDAWLASQDFAAGQLDGLEADCVLCGMRTTLQLRGNPAAPDLREGLVCGHCGLNTRLRAALQLLRGQLAASASLSQPPLRRLLARLGLGGPPKPPEVYVTEQATPTFVWMQKHLGAHLHGSEYEPDPGKRHALTESLHSLGGTGEVVFRDLTALDFADASLDAVASFDVLEHVPDYRAAIGEMARVLKPGGACVATFPFNDLPDTLVRARVGPDGEIEHIEPPEYHGDPISGGILCFYHFGWDVLARFREAGFARAHMVMPYSLEQAIPYGMWTLLAIR
ncbi:class I SAM-dependent methyltransferase [Pseudoxanthomonas suwonensis]|uniref:class I SAM-dependent methyltransferase n=1 Tax=Pseudoxanthomonas suwonensis TaxID=314722 RepID=UPI0004B23832|nr:class I SAM-dependent methyltransferase [Pseudoxanthomonas suwonensis]